MHRVSLLTTPATRALTAIGALLLIVAIGCEPKQVSEVPNLSGEKRADSSDRSIPGGKTLAAALALLDPRIEEPSALGRRRADFQSKLAALIPKPEQRASLGFDELTRWHQLYESRVEEYHRAVAGLDKQLRTVLKPAKGQELRVDDRAQATMCTLGAADGSGTICQKVVGYAQIGHEARAMTAAMTAVTEAQWHLLDQMARLRSRLDPDLAAASKLSASN
ncbi:MAG: hypothetical protein ACI9OJ_001379 [Myxococcota bacterium]|jgi:hypothetical protein